MRWCKKCVQPDTRPGIKFDEEGVCPACRFAERHKEVDWSARRQELEEIAQWGREHNVSGYDCIVGVSGGKDSTRQSMFVRDELGLKPLLVSCTYPPEQQTERGAHNLSNLISLGFDCVTVTPAPRIWKRLLRQGFLRFGNFGRSPEMALYACLPRAAIAYHIPLVFLGENPAIALGDLDVGTGGSANRMKYCHTLQGGDPKHLLEEGMTRRETIWYHYPADEEMEWADLRLVYLGYYVSDFNRYENARFSIQHGLQVMNEPPEDVGDITGHEALDDSLIGVNQMMKYLKFGFGKVVDQTAEAIRLGRMTRAEAVELVQKYDGKCAERYIERFCDYIGITKERFWDVAESYRNRDIWEKDADSSWYLKMPFS